MASPKKSDFLEGQLNHLSESQTANLSLFRESLVEKGVYTASVREAPTGQPYDDAYLLSVLLSENNVNIANYYHQDDFSKVKNSTLKQL